MGLPEYASCLLLIVAPLLFLFLGLQKDTKKILNSASQSIDPGISEHSCKATTEPSVSSCGEKTDINLDNRKHIRFCLCGARSLLFDVSSGCFLFFMVRASLSKILDFQKVSHEMLFSLSILYTLVLLAYNTTHVIVTANSTRTRCKSGECAINYVDGHTMLSRGYCLAFLLCMTCLMSFISMHHSALAFFLSIPLVPIIFVYVLVFFMAGVDTPRILQLMLCYVYIVVGSGMFPLFLCSYLKFVTSFQFYEPVEYNNYVLSMLVNNLMEVTDISSKHEFVSLDSFIDYECMIIQGSAVVPYLFATGWICRSGFV